jgi:nitrate reductase NapAB chaperone NapD
VSKTIVIPSNPADIKRIKDAVKQFSDCLVRVEGERDEMKAIADMIQEDLEIPKKVFVRLAKVFHKQSYDKEVQEKTDFEEFYEKIMK